MAKRSRMSWVVRPMWRKLSLDRLLAKATVRDEGVGMLFEGARVVQRTQAAEPTNDSAGLMKVHARMRVFLLPWAISMVFVSSTFACFNDC